MNRRHLYVTSYNGNVYALDLMKKPEFELLKVGIQYGYFTGITINDDTTYAVFSDISDGSAILKVREDGVYTVKSIPGECRSQHIKYIDGSLYVLCTLNNSIKIFNTSLQLYKEIFMDKTYEGINSIYLHDSNFYVSFETGEIIILNSTFEEINKTKCDKEIQAFSIIDNNTYILCTYDFKNSIFVVNNNIVFMTDNNSDWICKDFSIDDYNIYLVGGNEVTGYGRVYILNKEDYKLLSVITFELGRFKACTLRNWDRVDHRHWSYNKNIDTRNIKNLEGTYLDKLKFELDRPSLEFLKNKKDIVGVEIGVQYGINAKNILEKYDIKTLYLVDPYIPFPDEKYRKTNHTLYALHNKVEETAKKYLRKHKDKIIWIKDFSDKCINEIPDNLDFVYIDGDHSYPTVKKDIELYYPKIKNNGLISGHDFGKHGVTRAVKEFFGDNIDIGGRWDWWHIKGNSYE